MQAAAGLTTKVLAIGSWTAKAHPKRGPSMPFQARGALRLQLRGRIEHWFARSDGLGAVLQLNVSHPPKPTRCCNKYLWAKRG